MIREISKLKNNIFPVIQLLFSLKAGFFKRSLFQILHVIFYVGCEPYEL